VASLHPSPTRAQSAPESGPASGEGVESTSPSGIGESTMPSPASAPSMPPPSPEIPWLPEHPSAEGNNVINPARRATRIMGFQNGCGAYGAHR
jgi:hypothetical protein